MDRSNYFYFTAKQARDPRKQDIYKPYARIAAYSLAAIDGTLKIAD